MPIPPSQLRRRVSRTLLGFLMVGAMTARLLDSALAQEAAAIQPAQPATVQLTFPPQTDLRVLVDFVSQRLDIQILYDEKIQNKKVSIKSPNPIPVDSLLNVLESVLKMKGLALVDSETQGWKKIVSANELARIANPQSQLPPAAESGAKAITQTFSPKHLPPKKIDEIIKPFLTAQGANTIILAEQNLLIITDYAANLKRVARLIELIDQPGPERLLQFHAVKHLEASDLAKQINASLTSQAKGQLSAIPPAKVSSNERTNQLMIIGTQAQIEEVIRLAKTLDISLGLRTEVYSFQYIDAKRINELVKSLVDPVLIKRLYRSAIDNEDNLLIATGTEDIHERILWLRKEMDIATKRPGSGVKFYRLKFANAQDVLATLQSVTKQARTPLQDREPRGVSALGRGLIGPARSVGPRESPIDFVPGPNQPAVPGQVSPSPPALRPEENTLSALASASPGVGPGLTSGLSSIVPGDAKVTVDPNSNTIIVIADRNIQKMFAELIRILDRRRPQVMLEAKVVILDTSNDFSLGVELSGGDGIGAKRLLEFTSFGLSTVDPVSGALALIPGRGFNFTLVNPKSADAVVRALSTHRRAKVVSSPRILVNDNATGTLASVTEVPFTSVNASSTVATTSFAGFAEAGTTIEVTPRITDGDHLELDYTVSLNSFTGEGGGGVPPPRQTDEITSNVTIPDGYTVIVGGLTRKNQSQSHSGIPFLDRVPILRSISGTQSRSQSQTTLYVFLRPVILRDDKFRSLKYLSDRDLPCAKEPGNYPQTAPLLIR